MLKIIILNLYCIVFITFCFATEQIVDLKVVNNYQQLKFHLVDKNNLMRYGFYTYSATLGISDLEANLSEEFRSKINSIDIINLATTYSLVEQNKFLAIVSGITSLLFIGDGIGFFFMANYSTDDNWKIADYVLSGVGFGMALFDLYLFITSCVMIAINYNKYLTTKNNIINKLNGVDISFDNKNSIKLKFSLRII